jgi:hypothetical protein
VEWLEVAVIREKPPVDFIVSGCGVLRPFDVRATIIIAPDRLRHLLRDLSTLKRFAMAEQAPRSS